MPEPEISMVLAYVKESTHTCRDSGRQIREREGDNMKDV